MRLTKYLKVKKLAGELNLTNSQAVTEIFDKTKCDFLEDLSKKIINDKNSKKFGDLIAFAFWIRKKNIFSIKKKNYNNEIRTGRGLTFHITPSNVALNFAYSFVVSFISGNTNIVRVSNRDFEQNKIFFKILNSIFKKKKYILIKQSNIFIQYKYDNLISEKLSLICDNRIIWGSDKTINQMRKFNLKPSCIEVLFPDKYSLSIINLNYIKKTNDKRLREIAFKFFNDSFLFNQNSCTSPHLIIWLGKSNSNYFKFWNILDSLASNNKNFYLTDKNVYDKFDKFCQISAKNNNVSASKITSKLYRMILSKLPKDISNLRHGDGYFFEFFANKLENIKLNFNAKIQTVTYFGLKKIEFKKFIKSKKPIGINRIVPVGRASEFNEFWDGYDLVRVLSKKIELR